MRNEETTAKMRPLKAGEEVELSFEDANSGDQYFFAFRKDPDGTPQCVFFRVPASNKRASQIKYYNPKAPKVTVLTN